MSPIAQRDAVINYVRRFTHDKNSGDLPSDAIDRLIHERGLLPDPMTSRDGVHSVLACLNLGQRVAFPDFLSRELGHPPVPQRTGYVKPAEHRFDEIHADPAVMCRALLKLIGKWDPKL